VIKDSPTEVPNQLSDVGAVDADPLRRRYQVFVSSTYNDLIDERKHVMHALLVTKCIPSGMELFPAASTAQWELIKRVIDDCDYYVVVVAGKYGSVGPNGHSYTEMEFDYAVSIGKPILGFYHSEIQKLPGEKLEDTDDGKRKLAAFTAKVRLRICHAWISCEGLASTLKTAIYYAIETDPKPGWVRAGSVPTWTMVRNLEERIAELEGRSKAESSTDKYPTGNEEIEIPARIEWTEAKSPQDVWSDRGVRSFEHNFRLNWDEVFLILALEPGVSTNRLGLLRRFGHSLATRLNSEIRRRATKHIVRIDGSVDGILFDQILQTFHARKLFKQVAPPRGVSTKRLYWALAQRGIQKLAEMRAINSKSGN
jgi:hypothetical protein